MGQHKPPGLTKRGGVWHIDKLSRGVRIRESTGTGDLTKAQEQLAQRIDKIREARLYGLRLDRTFREAATKHLQENQQKKTISDDAFRLKQLDPFIGHLTLKQVHMGSLQDFIAKRKAGGLKVNSINHSLKTVRHILNVAASEWIDEQGMTWLEHAPKIKLLTVTDARKPYPLSPEEQAALFKELPGHLARMALFKVHTGCREQEVCSLKWSEEVKVPELDTSIFVIPGDKVKNGQDRLVVLNRVARSVVDSMRGLHPEHVFVRIPKARKPEQVNEQTEQKPRPVPKMNTTAWKSARERAANKWQERTGAAAPEGFRRCRVHDLKHTFGRRLRSAGVSSEDCQDLLGHKSGRITTHYCAPEFANLIAAAEKVCGDDSRKTPATTGLLRRAS